MVQGRTKTAKPGKVEAAKLAGAQPRANPDASNSEPRLDVGLLKSDYQIENGSCLLLKKISDYFQKVSGEIQQIFQNNSSETMVILASVSSYQNP